MLENEIQARNLAGLLVDLCGSLGKSALLWTTTCSEQNTG